MTTSRSKNKIAILGAAGVGKTTLWDAIKTDLIKIPEQVRVLSSERGYDSPYSITEDLNQFRFDVLKRQIMEENQAKQFLVDRSVIDAWAYYMRWSWNSSTVEETEEFYQLAYEQAQKYDLLIYVPIMFEIQDDGYRWANPIYQQQVDRLLRSIINDWSLNDKVYEINTSTLTTRLVELSTVI